MGSRKIHWVAWDRMCLPKEFGGMGFRDLESFNQAVLAKQCWRILSQPECLLAQFLKSRYYPQGDILSADIGARPSYAWRIILFGRELLVKGLKHEVGNGGNTRVWLDDWVEDPQEGLRRPWIKNITFDVRLKASAFINQATRRWNETALQEIFVPGYVELIMQRQPVVSQEDFHSWKFNKNGNFTVKSAYWLACSIKTQSLQPEAKMRQSLNSLKELTWKVKTLPKIKIFLWKSLNEALPVAEILRRSGMKVDERCHLCGRDGEDIKHALTTRN